MTRTRPEPVDGSPLLRKASPGLLRVVSRALGTEIGPEKAIQDPGVLLVVAVRLLLEATAATGIRGGDFLVETYGRRIAGLGRELAGLEEGTPPPILRLTIVEHRRARLSGDPADVWTDLSDGSAGPYDPQTIDPVGPPVLYNVIDLTALWFRTVRLLAGRKEKETRPCRPPESD